ncbi:helix-turn-helix transcriptional regulator [Bacillus thuringiensis]|uniref:winged helix-turn-helix transcriptional regulator n=1 Tax=Bacillus thuringiensis TaxID=1428 RepID=UPI0010AD1E6D|nr:helix-turn-helix domain-containing protein [Bacillus thuringiensis]TKA00080.1 helix-turn-helix transcriptional regulator [Bacillus thuringiensis]
MIEFKGTNYNCEKEVALSVIGGKWKLMIVWELFENGTMRLSELQKKIPRISQIMLINQLRELEHDSIVRRTIYPVMPPKVEYSLTEMGKTLDKVVHEIYNWGKYFVQHQK